MAHWAELDDNNVVVRVLVADDNDPNGDEGYQWLIDNLGGKWIKTSYNTIGGIHTQGGTPLRKNFAGIGFVYDETRDAFISSKPFEDWILNEDTCLWEAPLVEKPLIPEKPDDGKPYTWNEDKLEWVEVIVGE